MCDRFDIFAPNGRSAQNETSGLEEPLLPLVGSTRGKVQGPSSQASDTSTRTVNIAGVERPVVVGGLHVPLCVDPAPAYGQEYQCTRSGSPTLAGKRWRIVNAPVKTHMTAWRLDVVEIAPEP